MTKFKCLLACLVFSFSVFSESKNINNLCFTIINGESGLSQNNVKSILQDSWGFMWFGSRNRLNRYDGVSVKVFDCYDPVLNIRNNNIGALFEDKERNIWLGTDYGVFIFDPVSETFRFFNDTIQGIQLTEWVADIQSDPEGNIWIVIPNQGLFRVDILSKELHYYQLGKQFPHLGSPQSICIEQNGKVWIGSSGGGVYQYNKSTDSFIQMLGDKDGDTLLNENIYTLCDYGEELIIGIHEGKLKKLHKRKNTLSEVDFPDVHYKIIRHVLNFDDEIWVGTNAGLFILNEKNNSINHIHEDLMFANALSDNNVEKIYKDRENGIWIGTHFGGVNYLPSRGTKFEIHVPLSTPGSISSKRIGEMKEDEEGNIWIATEDTGVNIFNPANNTFKQIGKDTGSPLFNNKVLSLLLFENEVWTGFFKNGLDIINNPGYHITHYTGEKLNLNEHSLFALCEDRNGTIWLGTARGIFTGNRNDKYFKRIESLDFNYIYDIMEDSDGYIWIATMGNGVFKYDQSTNIPEHFINNPQEKNSLGSNSVSSISEDSKGNIWFSTDRGGISKYDKNTKTITTYSIEEGLPDDVAYKILEDKHQNLWFGTNKGLVRFKPDTKDIRVYTKNDGLPGNQFNYRSALASRSGKFYVGGLDGLVSFNPDDLKENDFIPPVYITKLTVFNKEIDLHSKNSPLKESIIFTKKITLDHDQSSIGFDFVALSFTAPIANEYAYKMEGLDNDWTYTSNNHNISYAKLPPGKYIFRVKGTNNDKLWNQTGTSIAIEILPPWWQSKVAYFIYFILIISIFYTWFYWYRRRIERRNTEQQQLFETEKEKELYSAKVEFFTDIAHEIKTPLTLINGPLESMQEMKIEEPEIRKNLHIMEKNTNRLMNLINQLLDFRKVDSNKLTLNFSRNNISDIVNDTYIQFEPLIIKKKKKVILNLPEDPVIADIDKEEFIKILTNLFTNAVKYSQELIEIFLIKNDNNFILNIRNDGELIPAEFHEKIFEPFYQLKKDKNTASSSGVGLSLVRSLIELHKGTILVETDEGINSFILELPLYQEQVSSQESNPGQNEFIIEEGDDKLVRNSFETVLLVEDNLEMLSFIADRLKTNFSVEKASSGKEALAILQNKTIDIIVSDVMMPEMNGFELSREIKKNIDYSHIPIVLLTAKNDLASKIQGLEAGAEAYVEKPFSSGFLITQLKTLLNNRKREREAFMQKPFIPVQQMSMNKADEKFMNKAIEIIKEHITDPEFSVERLAESLYMSRSSLHRKIKALSDLTTTDFIRLIRLKKAAELIQEGEYRVGEVCYLVGINSPSYFIKLFQKQFGMTPKEFAKQQAGG